MRLTKLDFKTVLEESSFSNSHRSYVQKSKDIYVSKRNNAIIVSTKYINGLLILASELEN